METVHNQELANARKDPLVSINRIIPPQSDIKVSLEGMALIQRSPRLVGNGIPVELSAVGRIACR